MTYDPRCYELAELFLDGDVTRADLAKRGINHGAAVDRLAQKIQERIEEFIKFVEIEMG